MDSEEDVLLELNGSMKDKIQSFGGQSKRKVANFDFIFASFYLLNGSHHDFIHRKNVHFMRSRE